MKIVARLGLPDRRVALRRGRDRATPRPTYGAFPDLFGVLFHFAPRAGAVFA